MGDLECLPIFLAACNALLIICGPTYTSRLWCILEVYVFVSMRGLGKSQRSKIFIKTLGADVWDTWQHFDANHCTCFDPADKARLMSIFQEGNKSGIDGFNREVQQ